MSFPPSLPIPIVNSAFADMKGSHVALRVPDFEASKQWFVEKLDFRVIYEWPYADQRLAYLAPANDNSFWVEILGDGLPLPVPRPDYADLGQSLAYAGYHHFCLMVTDVEATIAELRRRGVIIVAEPFVLEVINRKLAFFSDPWGNLIELAEVIR